MKTQRTLWTLLGFTFVGFVTGAADLTAQEEKAEREAVVAENTQDGVTLTVRNDNWADMRIYVIREGTGTRYRIGTVTSFQAERFELPSHLQADIAPIQILAVPIGGTRSVISPVVFPSAGDEVVWGLQNNLALSGTIVG